jgi:hypothetical protein
MMIRIRTRKFYDAEGVELTLPEVVRLNPDWAAEAIDKLLRDNDRMREQLRVATEQCSTLLANLRGPSDEAIEP